MNTGTAHYHQSPGTACSDEQALRVIVVGKGGAGKTVLSALMARAWSDRGRRVLAADLDVNPGLSISLGVPPDDTPLPQDAVEERAGAPYGWTLASHLTVTEAVRRYAVPAGPRIFYLGFGNISHATHPLRLYFTAVRYVADNFDEPGWAVVIDAGAGPTGPFEGYARSSSVALVVAEPIPTSLLAAQRLLEIFDHDGTPAEVVGMRTEVAHEKIWKAWGMKPLCRVPLDAEVRRLERSGALSRLSPRNPALEAARRLTAELDLRFGPLSGGNREG